ncbi:hypothetical protein TNCV_4281651 [Trichonephila clavipes]|nr:hypothetical protein TNCV_4281651 [Trichonephila clavipes]
MQTVVRLQLQNYIRAISRVSETSGPKLALSGIDLAITPVTEMFKKHKNMHHYKDLSCAAEFYTMVSVPPLSWTSPDMSLVVIWAQFEEGLATNNNSALIYKSSLLQSV